MEIKILIPAEPIPAMRPRFNGHAYQPKRNRDFRATVQQAARLAMLGREPLTGELSCRVKFYRKYKRTARVFGDVDNLLKAVLDGMNQIAFCDDSQIVEVTASKHTDAENQRVEVELKER